MGACKKARLFAIVRVFLLRCSKLGVSKCKKLSNPEMLVRCLGFTQVNTCLPRLDRGPCLRPSVVMDARMRGHDKRTAMPALPLSYPPPSVIPANAGIHDSRRHRPPIGSGVTMTRWMPDPVGHDKWFSCHTRPPSVIPAHAGIHVSRSHGPRIKSGLTKSQAMDPRSTPV